MLILSLQVSKTAERIPRAVSILTHCWPLKPSEVNGNTVFNLSVLRIGCCMLPFPLAAMGRPTSQNLLAQRGLGVPVHAECCNAHPAAKAEQK